MAEVRPTATGPLDVELAAFERERSRLLAEHRHKFALFKGDEFIGSFDSYEAAYRKGVERFGVVPFLVKLVADGEPTHHVPAIALGIIRAPV